MGFGYHLPSSGPNLLYSHKLFNLQPHNG